MSGNAEAAFPAALGFGRDGHNLRVDDRDERHLAVVEHRRHDVGVLEHPPRTAAALRAPAAPPARCPAYSRIVSNMSSMSRWTRGDAISAGGMGCAFARRTGWPEAGDLENGHRVIIRARNSQRPAGADRTASDAVVRMPGRGRSQRRVDVVDVLDALGLEPRTESRGRPVSQTRECHPSRSHGRRARRST